MSVLPQLVGPYHLDRVLLQHLHKALDLVPPALLHERCPNKETRLSDSKYHNCFILQSIIQDRGEYHENEKNVGKYFILFLMYSFHK